MTDLRKRMPASDETSDSMRRGYAEDSAWERSVAARMAQNDRRALSELFERTAPRVYAVILRSVRSPAKAAEILGLVFQEFWEDRHRARSPERPLVALLQAARRLVGERGATGGRTRDTEVFSQEVGGFVRERPPGARDLLQQIYFDGAKVSGMASLYGLHPDELRETLTEAMDQLRREMKAGNEHG